MIVVVVITEVAIHPHAILAVTIVLEVLQVLVPDVAVVMVKTARPLQIQTVKQATMQVSQKYAPYAVMDTS